MRKPTRQQIVRELRHRQKHAFDEMAAAAADLIEKQASELAALLAAPAAPASEQKCKCQRLGDYARSHHPLCDNATSPAAPASGQDDWRSAVRAACSHLDYPIDAPQSVQDALRALKDSMRATPPAAKSEAASQPGEMGAALQSHIQMADGSWVPYEQVVSVAEWPAEEFAWQVEVAGPGGYVRFVDFKASRLQGLLQDISAQGYAPAPDEDGFVTMKVKV